MVVRVAPWREDARYAEDGIKGARPVALLLSAAAQLPDGRVVPVSEGSVLPPEAVVLLRYEAQAAGQALLVTQAQGVAPRALGSFTLAPGGHDLTDADGELAGVSLEGERGPFTLALLAAVPGARLSESPEALRAALEGTAGTARVAALHVEVRPGHTVP